MAYNLRIHAFVVLRYLYSSRNKTTDQMLTTGIFDAIKRHPAVGFQGRLSVRAALYRLADLGLAERHDSCEFAQNGRPMHAWSITEEGEQLVIKTYNFENESPD